MGGWVYYSNRCTAWVPRQTVCGRDCGRYRSLGDRCPALPRRWLKPQRLCVCKLDWFLVGLKLIFIRPIKSAHFITVIFLFYWHADEQLCYLWNIRGGSLLCSSLINITSCLVRANKQPDSECAEMTPGWRNKEIWGLDECKKQMDIAIASGEQMTGRALARHYIIVYHQRTEILFCTK